MLDAFNEGEDRQYVAGCLGAKSINDEPNFSRKSEKSPILSECEVDEISKGIAEDATMALNKIKIRIYGTSENVVTTSTPSVGISMADWSLAGHHTRYRLVLIQVSTND